MNLNKELLEKEVDEFGWFKEDLEALEALLSKVTYDQRVFLNTLKEVVDADMDSDEWAYEHLVLQGCIEMYTRKPELIPNASLDILKKCLPKKKRLGEFQEMLEIMTYWADSVSSNRRPINKLAAKFVLIPKLILYPAFVAVLVVVFMAVLQLISAVVTGLSVVVLKHVLIFIIAGYFSIALGKAIILKNSFKRLKSLY